MALFDDVKLVWKGREFIIPRNRVMGAIARVEDVLTLQELMRIQARGGTPFVKLSMAYGTVLRYAGANVDDEDVYAGMFKLETSGEVSGAVVSLLHMMLPPGIDFGTPQKAPPKGKARAAAASTSKRRTKRRSVEVNG